MCTTLFNSPSQEGSQGRGEGSQAVVQWAVTYRYRNEDPGTKPREGKCPAQITSLKTAVGTGTQDSETPSQVPTLQAYSYHWLFWNSIPCCFPERCGGTVGQSLPQDLALLLPDPRKDPGHGLVTQFSVIGSGQLVAKMERDPSSFEFEGLGLVPALLCPGCAALSETCYLSGTFSFLPSQMGTLFTPVFPTSSQLSNFDIRA